MTDTVVNRCHPPGDGDIMVPVHSVAILGTTEMTVDDPDHYGIGRDEVEELMVEGTKLFPDLRRMRLLRAYAGVRPLYKDEGRAAGRRRTAGRSRERTSSSTTDRATASANFVSIVGGKLTTYRLMAEQTADLVARKLGVSERSTTAEAVLPGQGDRSTYWLGHRLAEHEARGGGDADLICECELVTRSMLDEFLDERWPCSLDDVRRGTRLGMGPCQGGFCTFRAAGVVAERESAAAGLPSAVASLPPEAVDRILLDFLGERYRGTRPIAWGRQLQELWLVAGLYAGVLGDRRARRASPRSTVPSSDVVVIGAGLAGMTAAIALADAGARVDVVARGHAATHWTAGGLDVAAPPGSATAADGIVQLALGAGAPVRVPGT